MARLAIYAALFLAALWIVWRFTAGRRMFEIVVTAGGVNLRGGVPGLGRAEVIDFISSLGLAHGARIWGVPDSQRGCRLKFSAHVPPSMQQRIRNFFYVNR
jgi:hypothetical protein